MHTWHDRAPRNSRTEQRPDLGSCSSPDHLWTLERHSTAFESSKHCRTVCIAKLTTRPKAARRVKTGKKGRLPMPGRRVMLQDEASTVIEHKSSNARARLHRTYKVPGRCPTASFEGGQWLLTSSYRASRVTYTAYSKSESSAYFRSSSVF